MRRGMIVLVVLLVLCGCNESDSGQILSKDIGVNPQQGISFKTIEQGQDSGYMMGEEYPTEAQLFVIKTQQELDAFWQVHSKTSIPAPEAPSLEDDMMLMLVDRVEPNICYDIEIINLIENEDAIVVNVTRDVPARSVLCGEALSMPYHFIRIAKTEKPFRLNISDKLFN